MTRQEEIIAARFQDMVGKIDGFSDQALKELLKSYKSATDYMLTQAAKVKGKKTKDRIAAVLDEIAVAHEAIEQSITDTAAGHIADAGEFAYRKTNEIVSWDGLVDGFANVAMSKSQLKQLVTEQKMGDKVLKDWIGSALAPDIDAIKSAVRTGEIAGSGYKSVVDRLKKDLSIGKGSKNARDLETVVKSYTQSMAVSAQKDIYKANKDLVGEVEWSAILEGGNSATGRGTCPRCIALDGGKYPVDSPDIPNIPLHQRCRCIWLPVTKTWKELGFDIPEMEKQYSPWFIKDKKGNKIEKGRTDMSYHEWFASRGVDFQNNAIGPTRAQLVRDGKLKLVDLVDKQGNLISIKGLLNPVKIEPEKFTGFNAGINEFIKKTKSKIVETDIPPGALVKTNKGVKEVFYDTLLEKNIEHLKNLSSKQTNAKYIIRSIELAQEDKKYGLILQYGTKSDIIGGAAHHPINDSIRIETLGGMGGGAGLNILKSVITDSVKSGFGGAITLTPCADSVSWYFKQGFVPKLNSRFGEIFLSPEKAKELIKG